MTQLYMHVTQVLYVYNSNNETTSFHTSKRLQHHLRMFIAFPNFRFANLPTNLSLCLPCAFYIY